MRVTNEDAYTTVALWELAGAALKGAAKLVYRPIAYVFNLLKHNREKGPKK